MAEPQTLSVEGFLQSLPADRRTALSRVRQVVLKNLPEGYRESMTSGMIGYGIPLAFYPKTYNGQPLGLAALSSGKRSMTIYLMGIYMDPQMARWFQERYRAGGRKPDMGKSCVHFRALEDLPLDLIGEAIRKLSVKEYIRLYEAARSKLKRR
jgi:hypothetical protein